MLRKTKHGRYKFQTKTKHKCSPSKASSARHAKRFGHSGSKAHKAHHRMLTSKRIANLASIRSTIKAAGGLMEYRRGKRYASYMKAGGKAAGKMAM